MKRNKDKYSEQNRNDYGTRKIKVELQKRGFTVSRRSIVRIIRSMGLFLPLRWHSSSRRKLPVMCQLRQTN
ncbi:IS3 family transposase [Niallia taxi]|uniref:HTH-like domain-containing protein n=1 Tax=Niallia taxi TaxID=2499688 RepID=A0A437K4C9_9BACI|nr:hypothetical protein EM808_25115 [Niallia taxi]